MPSLGHLGPPEGSNPRLRCQRWVKVGYEHARIKILGFDLHTGADGELIKETFGLDALKFYSTLPDPTDPLSDTRQHVFMLYGPICVISRKQPEFVEVFSSPDEFLAANGLAAESQDGEEGGGSSVDPADEKDEE